VDQTGMNFLLSQNGNTQWEMIYLSVKYDRLICAVAGCKGPGLGSQGELGGMLKSLGYSKDQVVKL